MKNLIINVFPALCESLRGGKNYKLKMNIPFFVCVRVGH